MCLQEKGLHYLKLFAISEKRARKPSSAMKPCRDSVRRVICSGWRSKGFCESREKIKNKICRKTCGTCEGKVLELNFQCANLAFKSKIRTIQFRCDLIK